MNDPSSHLHLVHTREPVAESSDHESLADFDTLYRLHAPYVAGIGFRLLGRQADADDLVQEVFMIAHTHLDQLRDPHLVRPWLRTIAVRHARRTLKKRRLKRLFWLDEAQGLELPDTSRCTPEQRQMVQRVFGILDQMPPDLRLAWTLRVVEGERLQEVAQMCECSLATVKRRIQSASELIHKELL